MSQKTRQRIRIAFGKTPFESEKDIQNSNAIAKSWRGADVQIEAAMFEGDDLIDDLANLATLILTVTAGGSGLSGAPLLQTEVAVGGLTKADLSSAEWDSGDEDKCHHKFEISKDDMQFDFASATSNQRELRMTLHGVTTDAVPRYITYGFATWTVVEDGVQNDLDVVGSSSRVQRMASNGNRQILHPATGKWHDIIVEVVDGILMESIEDTQSAVQ